MDSFEVKFIFGATYLILALKSKLLGITRKYSVSPFTAGALQMLHSCWLTTTRTVAVATPTQSPLVVATRLPRQRRAAPMATTPPCTRWGTTLDVIMIETTEITPTTSTDTDG